MNYGLSNNFTASNRIQTSQIEAPITGLCRFYLQGHCTKSTRCMFKHISKADYQRLNTRPKEFVAPVISSRPAVANKTPSPTSGKAVTQKPATSPKSNAQQNARPTPIFIPPAPQYTQANTTGPKTPSSANKMSRRYTESDKYFHHPQCILLFALISFANANNISGHAVSLQRLFPARWQLIFSLC